MGHGCAAYFTYLCSALRIVGNVRTTHERKVSWFGSELETGILKGSRFFFNHNKVKNYQSTQRKNLKS